MRVNEAAHWYPSRAAAPRFLGALFERVRQLVPQHLGGLPLHGALSEKVAQFKYTDGDRFERHVDGLFPGQGANARADGVDEWLGVSSGLSMLIYLCGPEDGLVGGQTRLWSADGSRSVDVTPRKGRALGTQLLLSCGRFLKPRGEDFLAGARSEQFRICAQLLVLAPQCRLALAAPRRAPLASAAGLKRAHVLALRLYTLGHEGLHRLVNDPLRKRTRPHPFPATVGFVTEALKKLRAGALPSAVVDLGCAPSGECHQCTS